jgi:hypothetical protein
MGREKPGKYSIGLWPPNSYFLPFIHYPNRSSSLNHNMVTVITFAYLTILLFTIGRILMDTHAASKVLAYLLLVVALPGIGMLFSE